MADASTSTMFLAMSFVALLAFISGLRKIMRRGEWSRTATMAATTLILNVTTVAIVITYLGKWQKVTDSFLTTFWVMPGLGHQAWRGLSLVLGVLAVVFFVARVRRRDVPVNIPAVLLVLVALISFGSSLLHGDNPFRPVSMVYLVVLIACTVAPRGLGVHVGVATCCTIVAIASGFTFLSHQDFSVFPCTSDAPDKCGVLDFNFQGVLENENALAMFLALAMPFVYIAFGSWEGITLSAYIVALTLITGSRSGSVAAVVTFVALVLLRPNVRRPATAPIRTWLLYLGLAAALIVGIVLPFKAENLDAFHGRVYLWLLGRQALSDPGNLWYGTGIFGLQHMRDAGLIEYSAVYSMHNQWMQVLYSTGLIGSVLFVAALALLLWNARATYGLVIGCVLVPAFAMAMTERPWPIDTIDWLTWGVPAVLLSYPMVRSEQKSGGSEPVRATEASIRSTLASDQSNFLGVGSGA